MASRATEASKLFQEFAGYTIRNAIPEDGEQHTVADLIEEIEEQRLTLESDDSTWEAGELDDVEEEASNFNDAEALSDFVDVPDSEVERPG